MYVIALQLRWLPVMGYTSPFENFSMSIRQAIMPVICLAIFGIGAGARQTRSAMLEVIGQDYIRTAWSKGLSERAVIMRHALKNGLLPVFILWGMHVRTIIGGSVLIETVFNIPGMGRMILDAISARDYAVLQGSLLLVVVIFIFVNFATDLLYGWLDPRIRLN